MLLTMAQHMQLHGFYAAALEIFDAILARQPNSRKAFEETLLHWHLHSLDDRAAFTAYHEFNRRFAAPIAAASTAAETVKDPDRPLRLGFVSRDFASGHSLKWAMAAWFDRPTDRDDRYIVYS